MSKWKGGRECAVQTRRWYKKKIKIKIKSRGNVSFGNIVLYFLSFFFSSFFHLVGYCDRNAMRQTNVSMRCSSTEAAHAEGKISCSSDIMRDDVVVGRG